MFGDRLVVPLIIWTQMVNTYQGLVNKCLLFGELIKELIPSRFLEENTPMMDALESIGHKVFRVMRLTDRLGEPSFEDEVLASLGKIEYFMAVQVSGMANLKETVHSRAKDV
ncbi:hypothetical protein FRX31_008799 [Thalictrum thalictroides]|uniref:Uncharacterized protein n=1 Tax=Thalictrum thalictroides TaxID=46969 RepID=A0A7J6WW13_THATH|nr:hypothetical protein FRX31_008799 [Thalictrum thalictroides]